MHSLLSHRDLPRWTRHSKREAEITCQWFLITILWQRQRSKVYVKDLAINLVLGRELLLPDLKIQVDIALSAKLGLLEIWVLTPVLLSAASHLVKKLSVLSWAIKDLILVHWIVELLMTWIRLITLKMTQKCPFKMELFRLALYIRLEVAIPFSRMLAQVWDRSMSLAAIMDLRAL